MYELLPLPYEYSSLEPYIDEETMKVHHDGHHQAYTDKLNAALENHKNLMKMPAEKLLRDLSKIPDEIRTAVRNFGGGYVNHNFLWSILKKGVSFSGEISQEIVLKFGSYEKFKEDFTAAANALFGSGYAWLVVNKSGALEITTTPNQDTPISEGEIPLITVDMWEHAYYLKHKNKKADYIKDYFNVLNWDKINEIYLKAVKS